MTCRYILDENVVIYAQRGLDPYGDPNRDCEVLVNQVIDDEFRTVVVDDILWDKYYDQLNYPGHRHVVRGAFLMLRFWQLLQVPRKVKGLGHTAPAFSEENDIPPGSRDDVFIARLAVEEAAKGTILVTADRPLRSDLASCGIQAQYGLNVVSPEEARASL